VEIKAEKFTIGIADMKMAKGSGMLVTYALGSCIGICLYDPQVKLGALIHIMLPLNLETGRTHTMKYADTGIRETVKMMEAKGASRARMTAKIAGGAKMFELSGGSLGNIGQRNIESVRLNLRKEGIRLLKEDVGGNVARTLLFDVSNGMGCVRCYGRPEMII
jgi:chemotaxis protein CheD